ncbi:hypothetical protein ACFPJ1_37060 [Kribbella qitaiheensis]|uniref:ApeA N-terminal domain 1-containing protein n=1 Tax=Kribbella qitaiheensis TaxID=1544730 RepID=UPI003611BF3B
MSNELERGHPRVGTCWYESNPRGFPAMVHDTGTEIELVFTFERDDDLERMTLGRSVIWADDPEFKKYVYSFPHVVWFADSRGHLCLVGPYNTRCSIGAMREGRVRFRYAVQTGDEGISYGSVNSLRSRVEGLEEWMAIGSVSHERVHDGSSGATDVIRLKRQQSVTFSRRLNATLQPTYNFTISRIPGQSLIGDKIHVHTRAKKARDWNEHLKLHRSVRDLLVVAGWRRYGVFAVEVRRDSDPVRALARNVLGPRWAAVTTYDLEEPSGRGMRNRFLFDYDNIGTAGLRRWVRLRDQYWRGIAGMIHAVGIPGVALETALSDAAAALESIGYLIAVEAGDAPGQKLRPHLRRITTQIKAEVGFDLEQWLLRLADVYRSVKHPDQPDPDPLLLANTLRETQLVFRVWVATRLGVHPDIIQRNLRLVPMSQPYERP